MTREEFCHNLADFYEALHDFESEIEEIRLKIIMEDNPTRKAWFLFARERLFRERSELEDKLKLFIAENSSVF